MSEEVARAERKEKWGCTYVERAYIMMCRVYGSGYVRGRTEWRERERFLVPRLRAEFHRVGVNGYRRASQTTCLQGSGSFSLCINLRIVLQIHNAGVYYVDRAYGAPRSFGLEANKVR